jgi:membrane complex biogenesis BtpA family protein
MRTEPLFRRAGRTLVGMLSVAALPGSPTHDGTPFEAIESAVVEDARVLAQAGFDSLLIQNTGDGPPGRDGDMATVAQLAVLGRAAVDATGLPIGVNVLKNGVETAFAVALAIGASFVRIKVYVGAVVGAEGIVEGRAMDALAVRRRLGLDGVAILADVHDRTSRVLGDVPLAESVDWALRHGRADGLVLTGRDVSETVAMLSDVRRTDPTAVLIVGGGSQPGNVASLLALADGVIVGSALRSTGGFEGPILADAARAFVLATRHDPG